MRRKTTVSLQRDEWEELVMEHIQAFTDKIHARDDLSLACRRATLKHHHKRQPLASVSFL